MNLKLFAISFVTFLSGASAAFADTENFVSQQCLDAKQTKCMIVQTYNGETFVYVKKNLEGLAARSERSGFVIRVVTDEIYANYLKSASADVTISERDDDTLAAQDPDADGPPRSRDREYIDGNGHITNDPCHGQLDRFVEAHNNLGSDNLLNDVDLAVASHNLAQCRAEERQRQREEEAERQREIGQRERDRQRAEEIDRTA